MPRPHRLPADYILTKYKDTIDNGIRYDIHFEGKNIAYVFTKHVEERNLTHGASADDLWVDGLHVLPKFQGLGLATFLMKEIERNNKGKTLWLRAKPYKGKQMNTAALVAFYTALGYKAYDKQSRMFKKIRKQRNS